MFSVSPEQILFLDIETVPQFSDYGQLPAVWKSHWDRKASLLRKKDDETGPDALYERAGIYAEFGKIICISVGYITGGSAPEVRIKSFSGTDEKALLADFSSLLEKSARLSHLCAHNGKEFDFPYLCRRMLVNGVPIPTILNIAGKKPWEVSHFDTMDMWKFGDYKSFVSLDLLSAVFGIPTPKDDMDGSMVYGVFYRDQDLSRIVTYCEKDVLTLMRVFYKLHGETLSEEVKALFL
jgi:uncharacterized protein YprB with RNaseH-like and TPR domain